MEGTRITRFKVGSQEFAFHFVQDWRDNFAEVVPRTQRLPALDGGFDELGDLPAPAEIGNVQVNFALVSETLAGMTAQLDALRALARWGKGRLYMQVADGTQGERWCWARLNNLSTPHNYARHTDLFMRVQASFQVSDPHWYEQGRWAWAWGDGTRWGSRTWGGGALVYAITGLSTPLNLPTRVGTAPVRPRFTFKVGTGHSAEDVTLQRLSSSGVVLEQIQYAGLLSAGDVLDVNAFALRVTKNGAPAYTSAFSASRWGWMTLQTGINTLRVELKNPSDALELKIQYYEAYV